MIFLTILNKLQTIVTNIRCKELGEWLLTVISLQAFLPVWTNLLSPNEQKRIPSSIFLIFLCANSGACNMFISHPLDTVKTNMQNENMRFVQAARILFKTEGVNSDFSSHFHIDCWMFSTTFLFSFFRQSPITVAFYFRCVQLDSWIQSFLVFMAIHLEYIKICKSKVWSLWFTSLIHTIFFLHYENRTSSNESKQKYWFTHVFMAGCTGGIVKAVFACPIELSKVRLQVKVSKLTITQFFTLQFHTIRVKSEYNKRISFQCCWTLFATSD